MPHPYRVHGDVPTDADDGDPDPMRRSRKRGVVLAVTSAALLVSLPPLTWTLLVVPPAVAASLWLAAAALEVITGVSSAHLLFVARLADRSRAQAFCAWLGGAAVVLAAVGAATILVVTLGVLLLASMGPWCGVCGT
jgi:hypothetical protein